MAMGYKDTIMLQFIREVNFEQGYTMEIWYKEYNVLGKPRWVYISGLMGSKSKD